MQARDGHAICEVERMWSRRGTGRPRACGTHKIACWSRRRGLMISRFCLMINLMIPPDENGEGIAWHARLRFALRYRASRAEFPLSVLSRWSAVNPVYECLSVIDFSEMVIEK